jgi:hypothetical protein
MQPRRNNLIWAGFTLVLLALVSYVPFFALFPITRDVPWVNYLLFLSGGFLLGIGIKRAFRQPEMYRGRIMGAVFGLLSLLLFGFFCYFIFYAGKRVPQSAGALHAGQPAPPFTLTDANGKQVALADTLSSHRGALLIFYRGYW